MRISWLPVLMALSATAGAAAAGPGRAPLHVRATPAVAPCVEAAARAWEKKVGGPAMVETGTLMDTAADVLVGAAAEVTRALESGAAAADSDAQVAGVPWVLVVTAGNPYQLTGLGDAARAGLEVWVAGGTAASAARRAAEAAVPSRVRESSNGAVPSGAAAVLAPLCLAGAAERIPVDLPDLEVDAAVSARAARPDAARDFVAFLGSPDGRKAFAAGP